MAVHVRNCPEDLTRALRADVRAGFVDLRCHAEVDSTNDLALALAAGGAPEGTAVLADRQRRGRGRRGREWFSPAGAGLYLSVILRPPQDVLSVVTLAVGVAAARAVRGATGLPVELKWPNDLMVGRPWRKLGGLLCETAGAETGLDAVVAGIGLNLRPAAYPPEIADRAASVEGDLGRPVDRTPLVVALLGELGEVLAALRAGRREHVLDEWRRLAAAGLSGAPVRWREADTDTRGVARGIDEDGALVVERDGRRERLLSGEVVWERVP